MLYIKDIVNSTEFYKGTSLHVISVCVTVFWYQLTLSSSFMFLVIVLSTRIMLLLSAHCGSYQVVLSASHITWSICTLIESSPLSPFASATFISYRCLLSYSYQLLLPTPTSYSYQLLITGSRYYSLLYISYLLPYQLFLSIRLFSC